MFDRILLLLLVLILPIGIIGSRIISGEIVVGNSKMTAAQEKKIDTFIQQVNKQLKVLDQSSDKFNITGVVYATESGTLTVAGAAPEAASFLWVWIAGTQSKKLSKEASPSAMPTIWKGPEVIKLDGNGFSAKVDASDMEGIVEVRLEQAGRAAVVKYDLTSKKQIQ